MDPTPTIPTYTISEADLLDENASPIQILEQIAAREGIDAQELRAANIANPAFDIFLANGFQAGDVIYIPETEEPILEEEPVAEVPKLDPAHIDELERLIDHAETMRLVIAYQGVEGLEIGENYARYEYMTSAVDADLNSVDISEQQFQILVLQTIYGLAEQSQLDVELLADQLGMTPYDLMMQMTGEAAIALPQSGTPLTTGQLINILRDVGVFAEGSELVDDPTLDGAYDLIAGYDAALVYDTEHPGLLDNAKAQADWFEENRADWSQTLTRLSARIREMESLDDSLLPKRISPIVEAFKAFEQGEWQLFQQMMDITDLQEKVDFAQLPPEQQTAELERQMLIDWIYRQSGTGFVSEMGFVSEEYLTMDVGILGWVPNADIATSAENPWIWQAEGLYAVALDSMMNGEVPEEYDSRHDWIQALDDQGLAIRGELTSQQSAQLALGFLFFTAGFIPVVGQVMTLVEVLADLARGDLVSAGANLFFDADEILKFLRIKRLFARSKRMASQASSVAEGASPADAAKIQEQVNLHNQSVAEGEEILDQLQARSSRGEGVRTASQTGANATDSVRKRRDWWVIKAENPELGPPPPNSNVLSEEEMRAILIEAGLDPDEFISGVHSGWTSGSTRFVYAQWLANDPQKYPTLNLSDYEQELAVADTIEAGLRALPGYSGGDIYRGINLENLNVFQGGILANEEEIQTIALTSFSRTELDWRVQGRNTVIIVKDNQSGVAVENISTAYNEGEVLVSSDVRYAVLRVQEVDPSDGFYGTNTKWIITLMEIPNE